MAAPRHLLIKYVEVRLEGSQDNALYCNHKKYLTSLFLKWIVLFVTCTRHWAKTGVQ
jgi:hypothetical protein